MYTRKHFTRTSLVVSVLAVLLVAAGSILAQGNDPRPELDRESPIELNPSAGAETGIVYVAYPSPHQQGGEEDEVPPIAPEEFRSTEPSTPRNERTSRGHAVLEFTNDLSRAYLHVAIENVNPEDITMFHLHCGRPGQLGPILIDFGMMGNLNEYYADGRLTIEITNDDIAAVAQSGGGNPLAGFTRGCPVVPEIPLERIKTIGGMELVARQGELYFNLHTAQQTFFGDIRGHFYLVDDIDG